MLVKYVVPSAAQAKPKGPGVTGPTFVALSNFQEKDTVKAAGFRWDPDLRLDGDYRPGHWWTDSPVTAARLADYCDASCAELIGVTVRSGAASRRVSSDAEFPHPAGLDYLPFQAAGIEYALARQNTLIADEMGLGKTIQAIGVINATPAAKLVLIVCPASLKLNWRRELHRWLVNPALTVGVADTKQLPPANVVVINYESVVKHQEYLKSLVWDIVIVDEAHYIKTPKSNRSKAVRALKAHRRLLLTGTPIVNRPGEVYPLLSFLDPGTWGNYRAFERRYLPAPDPWGNRGNGGRNLAELQDRMRESVMVRRLKLDVLTELPPKRRQVIEFEPDASASKLVRAEREAFEEAIGHSIEGGITDEEFRSAFRRVRDDGETEGLTIGDLARMRHDTALAKVPTVIAHVKALLDETPKVILFAHHRDVLEALHEGLKEFGATILHGDTKLQDRQDFVDSFQSADEHRVFVASLLAAGVGITLTASNTVVFAELDWVPGNLKQAEDRAHRIGSEGHESISVQYLVLEGSIDAYIANLVAEKIAVIEQAVDAITPKAKAEQEKAAVDAAEAELRSRIGSKAEAPTPVAPAQAPDYSMFPAGQAQVDAIKHITVILTGLDPDRAGVLNDVGWNKLDGGFGRSLAEQERPWTTRQALAAQRLVAKYSRQIPADLYALAIKGEGVPA